MRHIGSTTAFLVFALAVAWYYAPSNVRDNATAFIGGVFRNGAKNVPAFVRKTVTPQDPTEKRKLLLRDLKKNLSDIKGKVTSAVGQTTEESVSGSSEIATLVGASEDIINKLEASSEEAGVSSKITERILDTVLPRTKRGGECSVEDKTK